jgi:hypothetical protein
LQRSTYCSRVTLDNFKNTRERGFPLAIGRPLAVAPKKLILMKFRVRVA